MKQFFVDKMNNLHFNQTNYLRYWKPKKGYFKLLTMITKVEKDHITTCYLWYYHNQLTCYLWCYPGKVSSWRHRSHKTCGLLKYNKIIPDNRTKPHLLRSNALTNEPVNMEKWIRLMAINQLLLILFFFLTFVAVHKLYINVKD